MIDLIVIGGGASGFMGAITAAENNVGSVLLLEANKTPLEKVRISGGGRCNVTHACWNPKSLVTNYPRGKSFLHSPFSRFASGDSVSWFADRGLYLVEESDGRMFPQENNSMAVIHCLKNTAESVGVSLLTKSNVNSIHSHNKHFFKVSYNQDKTFLAKKILLATGNHPSGRKFASTFGHTIINPVPSLFSFNLQENALKSCSGISIDNVNIQLLVNKNKFHQKGKILLTHRGFSGPSILKLSSYAARDLFFSKYKAKLLINWINHDRNETKDILMRFRYESSGRTLGSHRPFLTLPKRFWVALLHQAGIHLSIRWAELPSHLENNLLEVLCASCYEIIGKGPFGEEFVTAGGVKLDEIYLDKMESRLIAGLYFSGEILDVDGLTGGFNFQHCWTSGWLAGKAIAQSI